MKAEILSIGTELLLGSIVDTNAAWLADQLPMLGVDLFFISAVGDNRGRLLDTLRRGWDRSDLIICTGGLGPTDDDLTREAISDLLGETMEVQEPLAQALREYFIQRRGYFPEKNVKQATLIPSAQFLDNPIGTAPGWWVQKDGRTIIAMPGVPYEMKQMWEQQAKPRLAPMLSGGVIISRTLKIQGKGESQVEEMLKDLIPSTNPTVATYAKDDGIHVRITAKSDNEIAARSLIFEAEMRCRDILGTAIYGVDNDTLEGVIGQMLEERNISLSLIEAGTGGAATAILSNAPRSQNFFRGGLVSQQRSMLADWGVDSVLIEQDGIVSKAVAEAMASAARRLVGSEAGVAICAVPGPDDYEGKPPGTIVIATDLAGTVRSTEIFFRTKPSEVKRLAALFSLNLLRHALLK